MGSDNFDFNSLNNAQGVSGSLDTRWDLRRWLYWRVTVEAVGTTTPPPVATSYTVSVMGNSNNTMQSHTAQVIVTVP